MDAAEKIWEIMRGFNSCMFVTIRSGNLRARPMAPVIVQEDGPSQGRPHRGVAKSRSRHWMESAGSALRSISSAERARQDRHSFGCQRFRRGPKMRKIDRRR